MRYQSLSLAAVVFTCVSAIPSQIAKRDWINDNNGNLKIYFSEDKIRLGTVGIDEIIQNISEKCSTVGTCDTGDISLDGQLIAAGNGAVDDITVTIHPSGSYPTWIHNGLIDALHAAVKAVADCQDVTHKSDCPNPAVYCPTKSTTINECQVPRYWGINYQPSDANPGYAPPNIQADMDMEIDSSDFCSTFTAVGSAVAGAVSGVGGGIFSLLGLFCTN
ncbi:hypothetical protein F4677DRAFT_465844 [Hypoxylon crocopeplum]|nr:hypothetical protein F4677DRAFT_465844 [Hypoxylon crocopeplum]